MRGKTKLTQKFWAKGKAADCPIYDMHGHMGGFYGIYFPCAEPDIMIKRMALAGVKMLVFSHTEALLAPSDAGNAKSIEVVRQFPDKLRAYCVVNPNYPEIIEKDLKTFDDYKDVYVGVKMHPSWHEIAVIDKRLIPVWEFADERKLLVLFHTWENVRFAKAGDVRRLAEKYQGVKFILGHAYHGQWHEANSLAADFPNVYLDLCAVLDERAGILEKFVRGAGSEKILYGTDFNWFNQHYCIGGVLAADITDEDRRNIFYRNAEKLLASFLR
ncbi:MAG: hypothetical protein DDT40_01261 [candidate division WS2 bacterium]|nr:hypothetical protein [Candidatus Psychracetigena formicireducens]